MYTLEDLRKIRYDILNQLKWEENGEEQVRLYIALDEVDRAILKDIRSENLENRYGWS